MTIEREIAGFAFPFAAGVTAVVIPGASPCIISPTYHIIASVTILVSSTLLLYSRQYRWRENIQWGLIILCALGCGALIGLSGTEMQVSEINSLSSLRMTAAKSCERLQDLIGSIPFTDEDTAGILRALLTGDRSGIRPEMTQAFRDSGASHILALSGLHLGIIYGLVRKLLSFTGNSITARRSASVLTILICGFYTLATGAGAPITRAFIFILIYEAARMTGRFSSLKTVLAASLIVHLAFDPTAVSEIGFQLSYAAIFGIAYIFPWLRKMWRNDWPGLKWIWESLVLSISCQITTGPLACYYFGTFPQYFLLTNLISVPLAGLIIPASLLTVALTALGCCPSIVMEITEWLVGALTDSLSIIASM
jgi:competence protein ComEC